MKNNKVLNLFKVSNNDTLFETLKKIDKNKKGFAIVVDENSIVSGVITDGDIRRALIDNVSLNTLSVEICKKNYTYVNVKCKFTDVIDIFKNEKIKFIPILDDDKHLVNIITKNNLHALLLKDIYPDWSYNFCEISDTIIDYEIFQRPWGFYKTTILNDFFQSKVISVIPKGTLSLQMHSRREEHWIIVKGNGKVTLDESEFNVSDGSVIFIPKGCKHRISNVSENDSLIFVEVQLGDYFGEDDIIRLEDSYGRT